MGERYPTRRQPNHQTLPFVYQYLAETRLKVQGAREQHEHPYLKREYCMLWTEIPVKLDDYPGRVTFVQSFANQSAEDLDFSSYLLFCDESVFSHEGAQHAYEVLPDMLADGPAPVRCHMWLPLNGAPSNYGSLNAFVSPNVVRVTFLSMPSYVVLAPQDVLYLPSKFVHGIQGHAVFKQRHL
ncbi:hypothetical protein TNCV_1556311 [Trichonephila clavipes]|nr:hypothetical protein TNCV_1556311 [Trichonephila clavipes]